MAFIFRINGVDMPSPGRNGWNLTIADIDSAKTTRNARAFLRRDRLRKGMRKIEITYPFLDDVRVKTVLDAVDPEFIQVTYRDPQYGIVTKTMYVGDRVLPSYGKDINGTFRWEQLSFSLTEQ